MSKTIKIILFSAFIGTLLASLFFLNIKEKAEAKNKTILYAYQVGVFKNEENASTYKKRFPSGHIFWDGDYFRIYIGVTAKNKDLLNQIFSDVNYYIKEIEVAESIYEEIEKYDELLKQSSEESKIAILDKMLESVQNAL